MQQDVTQEGVERRHVHHSYMWLGSLRTVGIILFATVISMGSSIIGVLAEGGASSPEDARIAMVIFGLCALFMLLVIVFVVVYQVVSYKHLYYELAPTEFSLYKGILSKKRVHIPYQRIQSVDQRASLFQRFAGVCTVSIDTAGGSSNKAVVVPYLTKQNAENLRIELFSRKMMGSREAMGDAAILSGAPFGSTRLAGSTNVLDAPATVWDEFGGVFGGDAVGMEKPSFEYGLSNKELVLTGLSNNTAFVLVVLGVVGMIVQVLDMFLSALPSASMSAVESLTLYAGEALMAGAIVPVVSSVLGVLLLVWGVSVLATCVSYGGFRACRRGNRIEVERGLLQHQFQGIDIDRVQSVSIKQTFIRRLMGYCELSVGKVDAAAENGDSSQAQTPMRQGVVVHPFVKVDRVGEVIRGIIPEYADAPQDVRRLAPVALRRAVIRRGIVQGFGFWLAVLMALLGASAHFIASSVDAEFAAALPYVDTVVAAGCVLAVVLLAIDVVGAVMWARESSFAVNRGFMQVNNGGLSRESICFSKAKIQFGYAKANPLQRRAKTATLNVRTAAGVGGTTVRLVDATEDDALAWLEWLKPKPS